MTTVHKAHSHHGNWIILYDLGARALTIHLVPTPDIILWKILLSVSGFLYDRSWQMEWYHTSSTMVPLYALVSADVGPIFGSLGFQDFYINRDFARELN